MRCTHAPRKRLRPGNVRAAVIDLKNLVKDRAAERQGARAARPGARPGRRTCTAATIEIQKAKDLGALAESVLVAECAVLAAKGEFDEVLDEVQPGHRAGRCEGAAADRAGPGPARPGAGGRCEGVSSRQRSAPSRTASKRSLGLAVAVYETDGLPAARTVLDKAPESVRKQPAYWMAVGGLNAEGG